MNLFIIILPFRKSGVESSWAADFMPVIIVFSIVLLILFLIFQLRGGVNG